MVRRDFIHGVGFAVGSARGAKSTVEFQVRGFTCVTCAVGLEVVLKGLKGVADAKAAYPEGRVTVGFDPALVSAERIREFIDRATGFKVSRRV